MISKSKVFIFLLPYLRHKRYVCEWVFVLIPAHRSQPIDPERLPAVQLVSVHEFYTWYSDFDYYEWASEWASGEWMEYAWVAWSGRVSEWSNVSNVSEVYQHFHPPKGTHLNKQQGTTRHLTIMNVGPAHSNAGEEYWVLCWKKLINKSIKLCPATLFLLSYPSGFPIVTTTGSIISALSWNGVTTIIIIRFMR